MPAPVEQGQVSSQPLVDVLQQIVIMPVPVPDPGSLIRQRRTRGHSSAIGADVKRRKKQVSRPGAQIPDVEVMRRSLNRSASDVDDAAALLSDHPQRFRQLVDHWAYNAVKTMMEYHDVLRATYSTTFDCLIQKLNSLVVFTAFSGCDAPGTAILEIERTVRQH